VFGLSLFQWMVIAFGVIVAAILMTLTVKLAIARVNAFAAHPWLLEPPAKKR
jgi:hypothetical protein